MRSKKHSLIIILVVCICAAIALVVFRAASPREVVSDVPVSRVSESDIVEVYVREHIAELAPQKAVLGGTWYVTSVSVNEAAGTGVVSYEDGHVAGSALFTYKYRGGNVSITSIEKMESRVD